MRDDENIDLYAVLQVHPTAEPEIVDAAYRRLTRMYHSDVNKTPGAHETMIRINLAYETLGGPVLEMRCVSNTEPLTPPTAHPNNALSLSHLH